MAQRPNKDEYYLGIASSVLKRGTCLRRNYGAVIVKDDEIVATGYTGAPRGTPNCIDVGRCVRNDLKVPSGQRYDICRSVHAEQNAIISAGRRKCIGSTLYIMGYDASTHDVLNTRPCNMCLRFILNAGISRVVSEGWEIFDASIRTIMRNEFSEGPLMPIIVCLCGSTKFKLEFEGAASAESLRGKIVIGPSFYTHFDNIDTTPAQGAELNVLHLRKIDLSDEVLVINKGGYIGDSTKNQIDYALGKDKFVRFLYDSPEDLSKTQIAVNRGNPNGDT
jgi:dCMP deaminase